MEVMKRFEKIEFDIQKIRNLLVDHDQNIKYLRKLLGNIELLLINRDNKEKVVDLENKIEEIKK